MEPRIYPPLNMPVYTPSTALVCVTLAGFTPVVCTWLQFDKFIQQEADNRYAD